MTNGVPRVLLDTTAVVGAGFGRSRTFEHLLRDAADGRVEVIVPELVVAETVFIYRRELFQIRGALKRLPSLLRAAGRDWDPLHQKELTRHMEEGFRQRLGEAGIVPVQAPAIDADELVERIHARRKPTKALAIDSEGRELPEQGEGFRDQLVWAHVREAAEAGPLVFVTDNTTDFGRRKSRREGGAELHQDLLEDLAADRREGRSAGEVELMLDVDAFVRRYLRHEDVVADMSRQLAAGADESLAEELQTLVAAEGLDVDGFVPPVAIQGEIEEATLSALGRVEAIDLVDAYLESAEGEPRVYGVSAEAGVQGEVTWLATAPSSWDLEYFSSLVEGDSAGGGFIHDVDQSPVRVTVYGQFCPSEGAWRELEITLVEQTPEERERRRRKHGEWWIAREQELGLLPSDDELAEEV